MSQPTRKFYHPTRRTERLGVNQVEKIILEMGFAWNEIHIEFGVDGQIEIIDTADNSATNRIVMVQVKGVLKNFQSESVDYVSYSCEKAHIDYWMGGTAPVIIVVCRPSTDEAYWKDLKGYFSDPQNRDTSTIRFSKATDRFDSSCGPMLANIASPAGGHHLGRLPKDEKLITNLFPVSFHPDTVWTGSARIKDRRKFYEHVKTLGKPWLREFVLEGDMVYSFLDLREAPLSDLVERGTVEWDDSNALATSDVRESKHIFLQLLYQCLRQLCFARGVVVTRPRKQDIFYCSANEDKTDRKIKCLSLEKQGTRTIADWHPSTKVPGQGYFRHSAFTAKFVRFEQDWFLEITPTYYFSSDGRGEHKNSEVLQSGIKRFERHRSVVGNLLMWRTLLIDDGLGLGKTYSLLTVDSPLELEINTGIDDEAWLKVSSEKEVEFADNDVSALKAYDDDLENLELW